MERLAHIDRLSDDLLTRILWPDGESSDHEPSYVFDRSILLEPYSPYDGDYEPTPPPFSDPARNLLISSVCHRWRCLAKRRVTAVYLKKNLVVSRRDLANAVACFEDLTHLILCDNSVETIDDAFLAQLAASRPHLKVLHVDRGITPANTGKAKDKHSVTEAGLDSIFTNCNQLEQLSLFCLHEDAEYPASFFQLTQLRSLAVTHVSTLMAPGFAAFSSLSSLHIAVPKLSHSQLGCLVHIRSLTSLSFASLFDPSEADQLSAVFSMAQLPLLKVLEFQVSSPNFGVIFPAGSPCTRLEQLLITKSSNFRRLLDNIDELLPNLRKLTIRECSGSIQLPESFTSLDHLEELSISSSSLASLPNDLGCLPALRTLILKSLPLSHLPDSLCQCESLETLILISCDKIRHLPADFSSLASLKTLVLESALDYLELLPSSLGQLSSLTRLELRIHNGFQELPEDMKRLRNLRHLSLISCSKLRKLPDSLTSLTSLETMVLHFCDKFPWMPEQLANLAMLKRLDVNACHSLGVQPLSLPLGLQVLAWRNNDTKLSPNIVLPSGVCQLDLELAERVTEFPNPMVSLSQLGDLTIENVFNLEVLPRFTGPVWQQLRRLNIPSALQLRELPEAISRFQRLTSFKIDALKMVSLPDGLGALTRLRQLDLIACSALQRLPDSLTQLGCLYDLNLSLTAITSLPPGFATLTRLRASNLYGCWELRALPRDFFLLKMLQQLNIKACTKLSRSMARGFYNRLREMPGLTLHIFPKRPRR